MSEELRATDDPWPVTAALDLLDQEGFESVSIRAVAARAGHTPMAVYRHVDDLDHLLRVMVRRIFEDWESRVYALLDEPDPLRRLSRYGEIYRDYAATHPHRYDLLFVLSHGIGTRRYPDGFRRDPATTFQVLIDTVDEAVGAGQLKPDDPVELALLFWSTAHGLVMLRRSGRFPDGRVFADFYRRSLERVLNVTGSTGRDGAGDGGAESGILWHSEGRR